ncbi:hypothetical protein [Actinomadura rugatobispora]|uniref:Uncharacterized protein n=1 Tax=Actinomadura rugatobispora TaxID=1994 RepID=A0ABW0ZVY0_9ACTN|nr:hypothetical protein GCM10010200_091080 [Actinomadura rugatobispora]
MDELASHFNSVADHRTLISVKRLRQCPPGVRFKLLLVEYVRRAADAVPVEEIQQIHGRSSPPHFKVCSGTGWDGHTTLVAAAHLFCIELRTVSPEAPSTVCRLHDRPRGSTSLATRADCCAACQPGSRMGGSAALSRDLLDADSFKGG